MKFKYISIAILIVFMAFLSTGCGSSGGGGSDSGAPTTDEDGDDSSDSSTDEDGSDSGDSIPSNLNGNVYDSLGNPISGAIVSVFSDIYKTTTGANGYYRFDVSEEVHTIFVSQPLYIDTYQRADMSDGESRKKHFMLGGSLTTPTKVLSTEELTLTSNLINDNTASLYIPPQSPYFTIGDTTSLTTADMSLEYFDINNPLPVPLPNYPETLNLSPVVGGKQAPSVLVAIKPALLEMSTEATLTLPNPDSLTEGTRILRFDPAKHIWVDAGTTVDSTPEDGTTLVIIKGGIYGIFYEERKIGAVKGKAEAGSVVFIGDEVYEVKNGGQIDIEYVHVPSSGALSVSILNPDTGEITKSTVTPVANEITYIVDIQGDPVPNMLSLSLSQISVKSDNSDSSTITASVLDINKVPVEGVRVIFNTTGGQISAPSVLTDAIGEAEIIFKSGTLEKKNQTVNITASVTGLDEAKVIPVQITGTTVSLSTNNTNLEIDPQYPDKAKDILTVTVKDAGLFPIFLAPVTVSTEPADAASLAPSAGYADYTTDVNGKLEIEVTGKIISEEVTIKVEALGATATQSYSIGAVGEVLRIIDPAENTVSLSTNKDLEITVKAPTQKNVRFATTIGSLTGTNDQGEEVSGQTILVGVKDASAFVNLSSNVAGVATIQVYDEDNPLTRDLLTVVISAPSSEAHQIALQVSSAVMAPSIGDVTNTVTLTATVKNESDQVVSGAPVAFSIENPTGGGEAISPVITYTDDSGVATSTFTSGSLSSDANGVTIKAAVAGMSNVDPATISIVIGGTAGSVVIGRGTNVISVNNDTAYQLPMSVQVADSNGSPVANTKVTLKLWPANYATGRWVEIGVGCVPVYTGSFLNEDFFNKNLILDFGEDVNNDGQLTPPNSAAGTLPDTVTTDENGIADFNLVYLKSSAAWIEDEITATTRVYGTETQSTYTFRLPWLKGEECHLPHSPYNNIGEVSEISLTATPNILTSNGISTSNIRAVVTDTQGNFVADGEVITFSVKKKDTEEDTGTLSAFTATTKNGVASVVYTSPYTSDPEIVTAKATNGTEATVEITLYDAEILVQAIPTVLSANGESSSEIRVLVRNNYHNPIDSATVYFSCDLGTVTASATTDSNGYAYIDKENHIWPKLVSEKQNGISTVTVRYGIIEKNVRVAFNGVTLSMTANPESLSTGYSSTITATLKDSTDASIAGQEVRLSTTLGTFASDDKKSYTATTNTEGRIIAMLTSSSGGVAEVTALHVPTEGIAGETKVTTEVSFSGHTLSIIPEDASLLADGLNTTTINLKLDDEVGPISGQTIVLSTTLGSIDNAVTTNDSGGATATLTSGTLAGIAVITATAELSSGTTIGSNIEFSMISGIINRVELTAYPAIINVNTGISNLHVIVKDQNGNPVGGAQVAFTIVSGPGGGEIITPARITTPGAESDSPGQVDAVFKAGSLGSSNSRDIIVQVTATSDGTTFKTATTNLTIAGGPTSIALGICTLWDTCVINNGDGTFSMPVAAMVSDVNGISMPAGYIVNFSTETPELGSFISPVETDGTGKASTIFVYPTDKAGNNAILIAECMGITEKVQLKLPDQPDVVNEVDLQVPTSILADGLAKATIGAAATDSNGENIKEATCFFETSIYDGEDDFDLDSPAGIISDLEYISGIEINSKTEAKFTANASKIDYTAYVRAGSGNKKSNIKSILCKGVTIDIKAATNQLVANGTSFTTLTATVKETTSGMPVSGAALRFLTTLGTLTVNEPAVTNNSGTVNVMFTSVYSSENDVIADISVFYGPDLRGETTITMVAASQVSVGSVSINTGSGSIVADGISNTLIRAIVKDINGNDVPDGIDVTFTTTAGNVDTDDTPSTITSTTINGVATATLTSPTNIGTATVTATCGGVSNSTSVNFTPGAVDKINLTATPNNLTADGISNSTIRAVVTDANDNPVGFGETITFTVETGTGTLSAATAITNGSGIATVIYTSSEAAGTTETITAMSANGTTPAVDLSITLIDASVGPVLVSAGSESIVADGISNTLIRAIIKDTSGNNVADETPVTFTTTAGDIDDPDKVSPDIQTTVVTKTTNGVATAILTSSKSIGTATIMATAGGISGDTTVIFTPVPTWLSLSLSKVAVKSDNSDSSTITATVLDASYAVMEGITVMFKAEGGQISASSALTDANGEARIIFKSGTVEKKNQTVNITASVADIDPKMIPVQITGTTVTLFTNNTNLEIDQNNPDKAKTSLIITVKDAGSLPVFDAPVTITVETESTANATLQVLPSGDINNSKVTGNTDVNGTLTVEVIGTGVGDLKIAVEALGYTATQTYIVGAIGEIFSIIEPLEDIVRLSTGTLLTITVKAPDSGPEYDKVTFATTYGTWDSGTESVITKSRDAENKVSASLSSDNAGFATVQVYYTNEDGHSTKDSLTVAFSAPSSEATQIALQASSTVVAPRSGDTSNTVTLWAKVRTANDQVVGGAPVAFLIENPTGGGETISPAVVFTNDYGIAETTFTSGSLSSDALGVTLKASVVGMPAILPASISIIIGGTASSVVIGQSSEIISVNEDTAYQLSMSVLVVDSNGNPVSNSQVTLSAWPKRYATGYWIEIDDDVCIPTGSRAEIFNEDTNRNSIKDPGEDENGDGELTPSHSAAGSVPGIVITDNNGVAQFDLIYLKASAGWIEDSITASTVVYGTETQSTYTFWLPWAENESCNLSDSPYNTISGLISIKAGSSSIVADGTSSTPITVTVKNSNGTNVEDGITVTFTTTAGSLDADATPTTFTATTANGVATATLTSSSNLGTATITATAEGLSNATIVSFVPGAVNKIVLTASPNNLTADGSSVSTIRAVVTDENANLIVGEEISFSVTGTGVGTISSATAITNSGGVATIDYTSSETPGTDTITAASVNEITKDVEIKLITASVSSVSISADSASIVADGSTTLIKAAIKDINDNNVADETPVTFTTTAGTLSDEGSAKTLNGIAEVTLTSSNNLGTATVTSTAGGVSDTTTVNFVPGAVNTIVLTASPNNLTADGSSTSTIRAVVTDENANLIVDEEISFSVTGTGVGTISSATAITNIDGVATIDYTSSETAGIATTTATSANGKSNTVVIRIVPTSGSGTLTLNTADSSIIEADGVTTATLTATVNDTEGKAIEGIPVSFSKTYYPLPVDNTYQGSGSKVTSPFYSTGGNVTFTSNYDGEHYFSVWLWSQENGRTALLANEIGSVSDVQKVEELDEGNYFFEVSADADGIWSIKVEGEITQSPSEAIETVITDKFGEASFTYTSTTMKGVFTIQVSTGELSDDLTITQTAGLAEEISVSASSPSIYANGEESSIITAIVRDANGNLVEDETDVTFSSDNGNLEETDVTTIAGVATTTLTSDESSSDIQATVTGTINDDSDDKSDTDTLTFLGVTLDVVSSETVIAVDGGEATITAVLTNANNNPVSGKTIIFSTDLGIIEASAVTGTDGKATVIFKSSSTTGEAKVTANFGTITDDETAIVITSAIGGDPVTINVTAQYDSINPKGETEIYADVYDASGYTISGVRIMFTLNEPVLAWISNSGTTDSEGKATAILTAREISGEVEITATTASLTNDPPKKIIILDQFAPSEINFTPPPSDILIQGTSNVIVEVLDVESQSVADGTIVIFEVENTLYGSITHSSTTKNGNATATFEAANQPGTAKITVSAGTASNSIDINVLQAPPATIEFLSAEPQWIALQGTGGNDYSVIKFIVKDSNGTELEGENVLFEMYGPNGGEYIDPTPNDPTPGEIDVSTNSNGIAQVILHSGNVAGPVTISATIDIDANNTMTSRSSVVSIGGGVPSAMRFSVSADILNLPGLEYNNKTTDITVALADRFGNYNVLKGTTVSFIAESGLAVDTSEITLEENGLATVSVRTQQPIDTNLKAPEDVASIKWEEDLQAFVKIKYGYDTINHPRDGLCSILVYTKGEEHFNDSNANGIYDMGDTFDDTFDDPFCDYNNNSNYDDGTTDPEELYIDFSDDGSWDGKNGGWDGNKYIFGNFPILITGSPVVRFSDYTSEITDFTIGDGGSQFIYVLVCDQNLNPLTPDSTVTISTDVGNLAGRTSHVYGNSSAIGPDEEGHLALIEYIFEIYDDDSGDSDPAETGAITVTVVWEETTTTYQITGTVD